MGQEQTISISEIKIPRGYVSPTEFEEPFGKLKVNNSDCQKKSKIQINIPGERVEKLKRKGKFTYA